MYAYTYICMYVYIYIYIFDQGYGQSNRGRSEVRNSLTNTCSVYSQLRINPLVVHARASAVRRAHAALLGQEHFT